MSTPVLWQFRFSHFNEKARWALDWKGVPHIRRSLIPGPHIPRVLWLTGQKSVPVLVLDGTPIGDSTRIIATLEQRWPERPLYPADPAQRERALALEDFFDEELGPHIRRMLFHAILPDADYTAAAMTTGFGDLTRRAYRTAFPVVRAIIRSDLRIDDASVALSHAKTAAALDRLEAELGPSGYLVGDRFSVADLTAAALFSPLLLPPEFPYALPPPTVRAAAVYDEFRDRPGLRWVAEMYQRHRGTSAELAA